MSPPQPEGQGQPRAGIPIVPEVVRDAIPAMPRFPSWKHWPWARIWLVLLAIALFGSLLFNLLLVNLVGMLSGLRQADRKVEEKFYGGNPKASDKIAIISIEGIILEAEDGFVKRQIDRAMNDKDVKAVVLRVDSPGGSVTGSDYIYQHLKRLKEKREIPIVVSMGGVAASGGYYVSMAVGDTPKSIFAEQTGYTGSIGVIMPHYNLEELMKKVGVASDPVYSHELKTMGSLTRPMTPEERKIFQDLINDSFDQFKRIVQAGRPNLTEAKIKQLATGRIYSAEQAKANGLIDETGFIDEAIKRAAELAKVSLDEVQVVRYRQEPGLASLLLSSSQASQKPALDLQSLLEISTPRAYYLCTWLPGLESAVQGRR
jgi:protease IV